jgi:hypothetical protein
VETTYCSICAADDVLFTDELAGLFDILDANPDLVVAHGYYVNFRPGKDFDLWHTDYSTPPLERVKSLWAQELLTSSLTLILSFSNPCSPTLHRDR